MTATQTEGLCWVDTTVKGYKLALEQGKLICQNAKGKTLASVPKAARDSDVGQELLQLRDWLVEHRAECLQTVETWMLRSLPVPVAVLTNIWQDPNWRELLFNAVVMALDEEGQPDDTFLGFLRDVQPGKGVGIVNLDGESEWCDCGSLLIPHPILLEELEDCRELAGELELEQGISQLFRETWTLAEDDQRMLTVAFSSTPKAASPLVCLA